MAESDGHPILSGLAALVGVGVVVGLIMGGAALAGTRVLGLGDAATTGGPTASDSLFLPKPVKTSDPSGPAVTLAVTPTQKTEKPGKKKTKTEAPKKRIALSAGQTQVGSMEQIDLTGVYPGGEGAILQVERFTDGAWEEFPVTASVSNETFSTYVQTGRTGPNRFRMRDTDTEQLSNEVRVQVG